MAIQTYGVGPTITAQKWAELFYRAAEGGGGEYVQGFKVSADSGTRTVSVATGAAASVGCLIESDAQETVTLENAGSARTDMICLEIDWTGSTSLVAVQGSGGNSLPALTKDAGVLWQVPLAAVKLEAGVGQLDNDDVTDYRPTRRQSIVYRPNVPNKSGVGRTLLVAQYIPYPGWDYRLRMGAAVNLAYRDNGHTEIWIGTQANKLGTARGADNNASPAVIPQFSTGRMTEDVTVRLHMRAHGAGTAGAQSYSTYSSFEIVQEPF